MSWRTPIRIAFTIALAAVAGTAQPQATDPAPRVPVEVIEVVGRTPHDSNAFTQGLLWHGDSLYESLGQRGRSEVRRVTLETGDVTDSAKIPPSQFGEGLALWKSTLISLTWTDGVAHRWDVKTLKPLGQRRYPGEGWGLATGRDSLILSDGTSTLRFLDPETMTEKRRVTVTIGGRPLDQLNELEMVDDELLANIWHSPFIVAIDPDDGRVTRVLDARAIVAEVNARDREAVLNGIAWDAKSRRLFITGKLWPTMFEVKLPPRAAAGAPPAPEGPIQSEP